MYTLLIILATVFAVYMILKQFGVFEIAKDTQKVASDISSSKKSVKKREFEKSKLAFYTGLVNTFRGLLMSDIQYEKHTYYINRLELRSNILGRLLTPEEVRGSKFAPFACSIVVIPLAIFKPVLFMIPFLAFAYFITYELKLDAKIRDEDAIIDDYFIELYLMMYSKLKQGSRARLQGTVENYIDTLQSAVSTEVRDTMLKLGKCLLNLLSLYEDHVAVPMLKEIYHSATIINFCNVASQSLNGIENFDNLLTFKMQLVERKTEMMRKRSKAIVRKGEMSIYAIYIILVSFVLIGWYSKLPSGMF